MSRQLKINVKRVLLVTVISFLAVPLLIYGIAHLLRPPRENYQQQLFKGIFYQRIARSTPRPLMIHVVTIDLTTPGMRVLVTPGKPTQGKEIAAQTTASFLRKYQLQLAMNANFFEPFHSHGPFDYYPDVGDPVNVIGQAISNGVSYSSSQAHWSVLCFSAENQAQILKESCSADASQAVTGSEILVDEGQPLVKKPDGQPQELYPRTAVAVDQQGKKLWLFLIDGRQPHYSEGVSSAELTDIILEWGVYKALNLDGGGSTTLVVEGRQSPQTLNSPIHTRIPMRQRPVANHLGFYAQPSFEDVK